MNITNNHQQVANCPPTVDSVLISGANGGHCLIEQLDTIGFHHQGGQYVN